MSKLKSCPFAVGDKVTTKFYPNEESVIRTVTCVQQYDKCESGWDTSVDGGEPCPTCGRPGNPIGNVDSGWFKKIKGCSDTGSAEKVPPGASQTV